MDLTRLTNASSVTREQGSQYVYRQRAFAQLLGFARRSIDDVVNCPVAKREVYNWFKTDRRMKRWLEINELERQWNDVR